MTQTITSRVKCGRCYKAGVTSIHPKLAWGLCSECRKEPEKTFFTYRGIIMKRCEDGKFRPLLRKA